MTLGPVFQFELLTTSRRGRFFVLRAIYGLLLLVGLYLSYEARFGGLSIGDQPSIRAMADFGTTMFAVVSCCQGGVVLLLTPALVAGAIAEERQRKTLHYLLASRLTGAEIVLGKLGARLLHLLVLLGVGLPILAMLPFFGGVAPELIAWTFAGTLSLLLALAGLSIFVSSVLTIRARDAIVVTYLLEAAWLVLPIILQGIPPSSWPTIHALINPALEWAIASGPMAFVYSGFGVSLFDAFPWMIGLQLAGAIVLIVAAVLGLRPSFRNEGRRRGAIRSRGGWGRRRPCGDDPMLWKEFRVGRLRGVARIVVSGLGFVVMALTLYGLYDSGWSALQELRRDGLGVPDQYGDRDGFNTIIRVMTTALYLLVSLVVAASGASSLTAEREEDTWISLVATDLTGREIIAAKIVGAIWAGRQLLGLIALTWLAGLATGSLHPFGALLGALLLAAFLAFVAALSVMISLHARTTARALGAAIGVLLLVNFGYLIPISLLDIDSEMIGLGCTPYLLHKAPLSYRDLWSPLGWTEEEWGTFTEAGSTFRSSLTLCILGASLYGGLAVGLAWSSIATFDRVVDRPRRDPEAASAAE